MNDLDSIIIVAVKEGIDEVEDIARSLGLPGDIIGGVVSRLVDQEYLRLREKNLLFVKKRVLELTERGLKKLPEAYDTVKWISRKIIEYWERGEKPPQDLLMLARLLGELGYINDYVLKQLGLKKEKESSDVTEEIEAAEEASNLDLT